MIPKFAPEGKLLALDTQDSHALIETLAQKGDIAAGEIAQAAEDGEPADE